MSAGDTALLVVDIQEKLIPKIEQHARLVKNVGRLIDGARILGLPVAATEQYPKGLGPTVAELAARLEQRPTKDTFSCTGCPEIFATARTRDIHKILLCGIEAQCLCAADRPGPAGRRLAGVCGCRCRRIAYNDRLRDGLARMDSAGATLTTTEAALFQWCEVSGAPAFKQIIELVREID